MYQNIVSVYRSTNRAGEPSLLNIKSVKRTDIRKLNSQQQQQTTSKQMEIPAQT